MCGREYTKKTKALYLVQYRDKGTRQPWRGSEVYTTLEEATQELTYRTVEYNQHFRPQIKRGSFTATGIEEYQLEERIEKYELVKP